MKDYIKREDFISATQKRLITDNPPSIYMIYKECNKHESLPINRTRLNKMINSIKSERNNIVHGKAIRKDLRFVAEEAIENIEKLLHILDKIISGIEDRLSDKKIKINLTDAAKEYIINSSYDVSFGARPIKRFVSRNLETLIGKSIIEDKIKYNSTITINVKDNNLYIEE